MGDNASNRERDLAIEWLNSLVGGDTGRRDLAVRLLNDGKDLQDALGRAQITIGTSESKTFDAIKTIDHLRVDLAEAKRG